MWDIAALAADLGISGKITGKQLHGSCPLHDNSSMNFSLNIETGAWTCFVGCGPEHGRTFIRLVMEVRDCNAAEALNWIRAGKRDLPVEKVTNLLDALLKRLGGEDTAPIEYDPFPYWASCEKTIMPLPFIQRGFSWRTVNDWEIRYDPFADAVVIPIHTPEKRFKGFIQRLMQPGTMPKYLYNAGLVKGEILFGLPQSSPPSIILVEGSLDAIWLHQHGHNAAAVLGSSLSGHQAGLLMRYGYSEILLGYDNDVAGLDATEQTLSLLIDAGWLMSNIYWVRWPDEPSEIHGKKIKDANDCSPTQLIQAIATKERIV